ncbi:hypothetical protein H9L39_13680 [Fusarium oxysporum f. sp. albedinis]|nr:hypothetical protein H9L39_13680 [Fusarium oxysporum f. sp. albedinis]
METESQQNETMVPPEQTRSRFLNSCNGCRARKVRCIKQRESDVSCINCRRRSEDCRFSRTKVRKTRSAKGQSRRQTMNPDAADPVTPLSRAPSSPRARSQPDNLVASPSCRSIVGNSDAEAQFEP